MISLSMDVESVFDWVRRWYSGLSSIEPTCVVCLSAGRFWKYDIFCRRAEDVRTSTDR